MSVTRARKAPVPELIGLDLTVAERVARSAGFAGVRVHFQEAYEPAGTVVGQEPARGALLETNSRVLVRVSKPSLVRYLPAVYRPRGPGDPSFLREYLWIFQHLFDSVTRKIDAIHELFNPYTTPPDFLPWLASWFAISFDESMSDAKRRRILREATRLYSIRGTATALARMVKLFTDLDCTVEENRWPYRGFRIGVASTIGVDSMILPEVSMSHTFVVRLPKRFDELDEDTLVRLHRIIEAEKPASSNYFLQFQGEEGVTEAAGFMRIGVSSVVGVRPEPEGGEAPPAPEAPPAATAAWADQPADTAVMGKEARRKTRGPSEEAKDA